MIIISSITIISHEIMTSFLSQTPANGYTAIASGYQSVFCYFSEKHFGCSALKKRTELIYPRKPGVGIYCTGNKLLLCRCGLFILLSRENQELKEDINL